MDLKISSVLLIFTVLVSGKKEKHEHQSIKIHESTRGMLEFIDSTPKLKTAKNEILQRHGKKNNNLFEDKEFTNNKNQKNNKIQIQTKNNSTYPDGVLKNLNQHKRSLLCNPGKTNAAQYTNHSSKNENRTYSVSSIMKRLNQGTNKITYSSDSNIILILGLSGAGKSTFTQYIGNNPNLTSVAKTNDRCQKTSIFQITDPINKIGHGAHLSHTELPDLVIDPETNTTMYDCPGFSDTRDPDHDISGAYFIKAVTDRAKALKFIFIVNYDSVIPGASREEFMKLAKHATHMIQNISKFNESIALVATKIKDSNSDDQRIIDVTTFLCEFKSELNGTNKDLNVQTFIDILLTTDASNENIYPRIGFMPIINAEGPLVNMPAVQAQKQKLKNIIHNNIKYTPCDSTDINSTISAESVIYVNELIKEVTKSNWRYITNVVQKIQTFYDNLIQIMLDKILYFNQDNCTIDMKRSEAESFFTKVDEGSSIISEFLKQTENITDLAKLSEFIITSKMTSEFNLSQEIISNVSTQQQYLEFLFTIQKPKDSLSSGEWIALSQNLKTHIQLSRNYFYSNVSSLKDRIKSKILSIDNNIMNEIQKNFSRLQENIFDNKKLSLMLHSGYTELKEIHAASNNANVSYKCIHQIQKTVDYFNFTNTNIGPIDDTLKNISKLGNYLHFLQTPKYRSSIDSLECAGGINHVISHLDSLNRWYSFLDHLFENLAGCSAQKNINKCHSFSLSMMSHKAPASVTDIITSPFVETCFPPYKNEAPFVQNIVLDEFMLDALKLVINSTLSHPSDSICNPELPDRLVVNGHYVKLSDIERSVCKENARFVEIFALKKIFIDTDLNASYHLTIIAPIWDICGEHKIILAGKNGDNPTPRKAENGEISNGHGKNGIPGLPGGPGGHFFGIGAYFIGSQDLTISTIGGNGGPGQDGGDGMDAANSTERPVDDDDIKFPLQCSEPSYLYRMIVPMNCKLNITIDDFPVDVEGYSINRMTWTFHPKNENIFKGNGSNGGNGGKGGKGGYPGNITIIALQNYESINKISRVGSTGSDGIGGRGGKKGKARDVFIKKDIAYETYIIPHSTKNNIYYFKQFHSFADRGSNGSDGINGTNMENIKNPSSALSLLDFSQKSIIDYKTYVYKYLSGGMKDSDLKSFLNLLETNSPQN